jgi:hypothetical protein
MVVLYMFFSVWHVVVILQSTCHTMLGHARYCSTPCSRHAASCCCCCCCQWAGAVVAWVHVVPLTPLVIFLLQLPPRTQRLPAM